MCMQYYNTLKYILMNILSGNEYFKHTNGLSILTNYMYLLRLLIFLHTNG